MGKGEMMGELEGWRLKSWRGLKIPCWARVIIRGDNEGLAREWVGMGMVVGECMLEVGVCGKFVLLMVWIGVWRGVGEAKGLGWEKELVWWVVTVYRILGVGMRRVGWFMVNVVYVWYGKGSSLVLKNS